MCLIPSEFNVEPVAVERQRYDPSPEQENVNDKEQSDRKSVLEDAVDPRDLVLKGRSVLDPTEIGTNPALAPETVALNEPAEVREGFDFNRDREDG
ncbi:MAG: hypothetical protein LDL41_01705 [Coleofasciculus sp. S288]|nr:hypothetical protein [Coleofasciculus sp. S288]